MLFCSNCGHQLNDDAKFCHFCGAKVEPVVINRTKRETVFEGNIHKCPNCGETVNSFSARCPSCGHEFREINASTSVQDLAEKLRQIEIGRSPRKGIFAPRTTLDVTDEQKISLIKSFPIPNSREDLLEFIILASSNIDNNRYNDFEYKSESQKAVSDAWEAKFEQAYQKAKLSFQGDSNFIEFDDIYKSKKSEVNKHKKNMYSFMLALIGLLFLIIIMLAFITAPNRQKASEETDRLNTIMSEIYDAIDNKEYALAKAKTTSLVYSGNSSEAKKWDKAREDLLKIIEEAEKNSNKSESASNPDVDNTSNESKENTRTDSQSSNVDLKGNFVSGFVQGISNGFDKITKNLEESSAKSSDSLNDINKETERSE